jgi:hypothetical protein
VEGAAGVGMARGQGSIEVESGWGCGGVECGGVRWDGVKVGLGWGSTGMTCLAIGQIYTNVE